MPTTEEILRKYSRKIESRMNSHSYNPDFSREYTLFKEEMLPESSRYKNWANTLGNFIKVKISEKEKTKLQKELDTAHLDVTPSQAVTLAIFSLLSILFLTAIMALAIFFINGSVQLLFGFLGLLTGMFIFYYSYTAPKRLANSWRLKASSQMVPAILYIVVYMKHTSNLERAIQFASQHLDPPLALDFRKVFYDVEIGRFSTLKQSLENYLEKWRTYSPEFVESFHLIESSLYEPSETRRIQILERALQVILEGIYEKMLRYSRNIRSPLTNLYMLGIILPILGIALLPLASILLGDLIKWQHVLILFNIILPFLVFYKISETLLSRPGGHGESSSLELNPQYSQFISKKPWITAFVIAFPFLLLGLLPFIFQIDILTNSVGLQQDYTFSELGLPFFQDSKIFDFKETPLGKTGPFGLMGVLLSLFIPFSIMLFFSVAYRAKTKNLIKSRQQTLQLEDEFTNSLFQLGNRLGDGIPAEIAFAKVAETTQGQKTHNFFSLVNQNISQLGMSIEQAIFNTKRGAIIYFPSSLIKTSMKVLIESVKKGPKVAAASLMSISEYVKNIKRINERLRDMLAEVISDMKSNMTFLAPLLAGIVVGLSAMIAIILNQLQTLTNIGAGAEVAGVGLANITNLFDITTIIPPYFIQAIIGIFVIEIIFMLTSALTTVDAGKDPLKEKHSLYKNLRFGVSLYLIIAAISIIALSALAAVSLGSLG